MQQLLEEYFPKPEEADRCEIFVLYDLERLKREERRINSLRNPNLYNGWREFVKNLPESNEELVLSPEEKYVNKSTLLHYFQLRKLNIGTGGGKCTRSTCLKRERTFGKQ